MTRECDNCGSTVSVRFHKVFADNDGTLHGCHECQPNASSKHPDKIDGDRGRSL